MQLTNEQIVAAHGALEDLGQQKMPIKAGFKVARMRRKIRECYSDFTEAQNGLVLKYSKDGQQVDPDSMADFLAERSELLQQEVEVEVETISESALEQVESLKPATLEGIEFMVAGDDPQ